MPSPSRALLTPPETPTHELPSAFGVPVVGISPVFKPDARLDPSCAPDLVVISSDRVLFYVHSKLLLYVSMNAFSGLLSASECKNLGVIRVQSDATVLNLVLHAIYGLDMAVHDPSLDLLTLALKALLVDYSVPPDFVLSPGRPLFEAVLAYASARPLYVYSLAAHYNIEPLAVAASAHMLSFPLAALTEDDAHAMGAVYLRRLFFLHLGRVEALKRLLVAPPAIHPPTVKCDASGQQQKMRRVWELAISAIALDARPDTSSQALETALGSLLTRIWCIDCHRMLNDRMQKLVAEWSAVKRTI